MFITARKASIELGVLHNSIRRGDGNLIGFLGEYITREALGCTQDNTYHQDLLLGDIKIDVKTKATSVKPLDIYDCSVTSCNATQQCDIYVFTRIIKTYEKGWVLGWLTTEDYFKKARFLKKGEVDPSNKYTVKADCYNVAINELNSINDLLTMGKK